MYCHYCEEEQGARAKFCKRCGAKLVQRSEEVLSRELEKQRFLVSQVERWSTEGKLARVLVDDLLAPHRKTATALQAALAVERGEAPPAPAHSPAPAPTPSAPTPPVVLETTPAPAPTVPAEPAAPVVPEPVPIAAAPLAAPVPPEQPAVSPKDQAAEVAQIGVAALAAAAVPEPLDMPEPPRTREQEIVERESTWSKVWRPFLTENVGWFLGAFAVLAGSFWWVAESKGTHRTLLVTGLLLLYSTLFWWVGRHLAVKRGQSTAGRVLASISAAMSPMPLLALAPMRADNLPAWAGASAGALLAMVALVRACAGIFGVKSRDYFSAFVGFQLALVAVVPFFHEPWLLAGLDALALGALWLFAPSVGEEREDKGHAAFLGLGLAWLALVVILRVHFEGARGQFDWLQYGPLLALLVAVVLRAERALLGRTENPSWLAILGYVALLPAAFGSASVEYAASKARGNLLPTGPSFGLTAAIATILLIVGARTWRSRVFTGLALVVGWLSFHALTGFMRLEWILAIAGGVKHLAGYDQGQRLPFNYGGLASLIYLAGVCWAYHLAKRREAGWALGTLRVFGLGLALFLLAWSHVGTDFKPALFTSLVIFLGALALSHWLMHWRLSYLSAFALVLLGLDSGLLAQPIAAAPVALGLGLSLLVALLLALILSAQRARAFCDLAFVGLMVAACLLPFSGASSTAASAWLVFALAGVGLAFGLGSGLPAALGLVAAGGGVLLVAHEAGLAPRGLTWLSYGLTFALLGLSGLASRPAGPALRGHWFGSRLPLTAEGFDLVRGPAAFAGFVGSIASLVLAAVADDPSPALCIGAFALAQLWLARRQASATFLTFAILAGTTALLVATHEHAEKQFPVPLAAAALLLAVLAALVGREGSTVLPVTPLLRRALRVPPRRAGVTFLVHSAAFATLAGIAAFLLHLDGKAPATLPLALSAAAFLLLPQFHRWAGWLFAAALCWTTSVAVLFAPAWTPLVIAAGAFVPLALGLASQRAGHVTFVALGVEAKPLLSYLTVLAHLQALAAMLAMLAVDAAGVGERWQLATAAATLSAFYLLAPRLDGHPTWLALFGLGAWASAALALPASATALSLGAFAAILVALGSLAQRRHQQSANVLGATGLALALTAVGAWSIDWPEAVPSTAGQLFLLVSLAFFLAPRIFTTSLFLPVAAAALAAAAALHLPGATRPLALGLLAVGVALLAAVLRRVPSLTEPLFGLAKNHSAVRALSGTALALALLPLAADLPLAAAVRTVPTAGLFALGATAATLCFLASGWSVAVRLSVVLFAGALATLDVGHEVAFLCGLGALNVVFLLAGALRTDWGARLGDRLFCAAAPVGMRTSLPASTTAALTTTTSALAYLSLAVLVLLALARLLAFSVFLDPVWAPYLAGAQVLTALHQIRRRPALDSWHGVLIAVLASLWLLGGPEAWPFLATGAAVVFAALSGALGQAFGRDALEALAPDLQDDDDAAAVGTTLRLYSTLAVLLGCALTRLDPHTLDAPLALLTGCLALGIQAGLGSPSGRVLFFVAVPLAVHVSAFHVGIRLSTGRPQEAILPWLAASMALVAFTTERVGKWRKDRGGSGAGLVVCHLYALLAAFEWGAALTRVRFTTSDLAASLVAGGALTVMWTFRAQASGRKLSAWLAQSAFITLYLSLRVQTDWLGPRGARGEFDPLWTLLLGFLFLGLHTAVKRLGLETFRSSTRAMALLLPVVSGLLLEHHATVTNALLLFGVALQLTFLSAVEGRGKVSGLMAALAYNLAISVLWLRQGIQGTENLQFYVIPAGLTLVALSWIYRESLGPTWHARLRSFGVLAIYCTAAWPALSSIETPAYLVWCMVVCVVGVAVGIALRVRSYLYLGTAFFVLSVLGYTLRHGLRDHRVLAFAGTALGLLILGFMTYFTAKRQEVLERFRKLQTLLAEWD